ncbi:MAG: outer membrane beta-barrel protein [Opitutae bacterium]|nr:outer membrane beta-barrel protein [Opitutae bacterium]
MTLKSLLPTLALFATVSAATVASAAVYVDVTAAKLEISGTPAIGDIGAKLDDDLPSSAVTFAVGYEVTPRIAVELRYSDLGDIRINKVSPVWALFPPSGAVAQTLRYYRYKQSTQLYTIALPIKLIAHGPFSLSIAPLAHFDRSEITLTDLWVNVQTFAPQPPTIAYRDTRAKLHVGGELKLAYRFSDHVGVHASYSYSALETYDAHLIGAGLEVRF